MGLLACDKCRAKLEVGKFSPGVKIRCPKCKTILVIPDMNRGAEPAKTSKPASPPAAGPKPAERVKPLRPAQAPPAASPRRVNFSDPEDKETSRTPRHRRGARGDDPSAHAPTRYSPLILSLVAACVLLAAGLGILLVVNPGDSSGKSEKTGDPASDAPVLTPEQEFLKAYPVKKLRAEGDLEKMYTLSQECKKLGQNHLYREVTQDIRRLDPKIEHTTTQNVLREQGYEFLTYHVEDAEKSDTYKKTWKTFSEWLFGDDLAKAKEKESLYQAWAGDGKRKREYDVKQYVNQKTGLPHDEMAVEFTAHFAIVIQRAPNFNLEEAHTMYRHMLEGLYDCFMAYLKPYVDDKIVSLYPLEADTDVIFVVFKEKSAYHQLSKAPVYAAGHYSLEDKILYTFKGNNTIEYEAIVHEGTHMLVDFCLAMPLGHTAQSTLAVFAPWFNEGIAEYFGSLKRDEVDVNKWIYCAPSRIRLREAKAIIKATAGKPLLEYMLKLSYENFQANPNQTKSVIYSGGWSLSYFLNNFNNGQYRRDYVRFFNFTLNGRGGYDAFKETFKKHDLKKIEEEWRRYILDLDWDKG